MSTIRSAFSFSKDAECGGWATFTDESASSQGITGWAWNFGDGHNSTLQDPAHHYSNAGTYKVELQVTDSAGRTAKSTVLVQVAARDECAPLVSDSYADSCASCIAPEIDDKAIDREPVRPAVGAPIAQEKSSIYWALGAGAIAGILGLFMRYRAAFVYAIVYLFTRLKENKLLDHPIRAQIHALVKAQPGIHLRAITRSVARDVGVVRHHLEALQRAELIQCHHADGHARYFVATIADPRMKKALATLGSPVTRQIWETICSNPGATISAVANMTAMRYGLVRAHVKKLRQGQLVMATRQHKSVHLRPSAASLAIMHSSRAAPFTPESTNHQAAPSRHDQGDSALGT
ncbi:MAG: PKD domain-containing protein [Halobacteriales archaeon]|nr:PKD domain-containing protein [Halobacteriales archaeon]